MKRKLSVRWLLSVTIIILSYGVGYSNPLLVWPDHPNGQLYRIDVQGKVIEREAQPNVWQLLSAINLKNVALDDFPPVTRVTCLPIDRSRFRYLLVECTQQVYRFDYQTQTLERLDETFYRGYNCFSSKFLRHDTLYSFGGYGFWRTNNILSYYKSGNREWESITQTANVPRSIFHGFNGYVRENDSYFSALNFYENDSENNGAYTWDDSVYSYSFRGKSWRLLGRLTDIFRQNLPDNLAQETTWFQVGQYFILKYYKNTYETFLIVNPVSNEARIWKDTHSLITTLSEKYDSETGVHRSYAWNNSLYFRRDVTGITGNTAQIIQFSITDLWKNSRPIGAIYESNKTSSPQWIYGLSAIIVFMFLGMLFWFRRSSKPKVENSLRIQAPTTSPYPHSLNSKERDVFEALLKTGPVDGISGERLNEILSISDKSIENQRKIRAEVIKGINLKLKLEWSIDEAIERLPTALDQRMFTYALKPSVQIRARANQK